MYKSSSFSSRKFFSISAILFATTTGIYGFAIHDQKGGSRQVTVKDLTSINVADAACQQRECDGAGSGCSVTVDGTVFVSSACKAKRGKD
jgi:hypothetical protein